MIYTFDRPYDVVEAFLAPYSDEVKTKSAGYMTVEQQVRAMQAAGQQLQMSRASQYNTVQELEDPDFFNGIPEMYHHLISNQAGAQIRDIVHTWRVNEIAAREKLLAAANQTKQSQEQPLTQDSQVSHQLEKLQDEIQNLKRGGNPAATAAQPEASHVQ